MEEDVWDFNLFDEDFEEFMRRGRESFGIGEEKQRDGDQERH
jgi:hypothetical protein